MTPDADHPTTYREDLEAYRSAVNSEAQHDADDMKNQAMRQGDVGGQVAYLSKRLRQDADAIADVRVFLDGWVPQQSNYGGTHSEFCYQWHPDCLVQRIQDALRTVE